MDHKSCLLRLVAAARRTGLLVVLLAALTAGVLASCDSHGGRAPGGQPANGDLAGIPLPAGAQPLGPSVRKQGVSTRSYKVTGISARDVFELYERALPPKGWTEAGGGRSGATDYRSVWDNGGQRLTVSTSPFGSGGGVRTQLNLQLTNA
jgi:hypothetical protein